MGVPLTYMDFAPEPPAPTATPVITTEVNCTPSQDTKDLSSEYILDTRSLMCARAKERICGAFF